MKLLTNQTKKNFNNFDISPVQQIKNILVNKEQLVKKTQLRGIMRGSFYKILGKSESEEVSRLVE